MFRGSRNSLFVLFILVASFLIIQKVNPVSNQTQPVKHESLDSIPVLSEYTNHIPIDITSNQDFENQGWPGNGTADFPYVIENLNITSDMILTSDDRCIRIEDTTVHFVIRNCILRSNAEAWGTSIQLHNVTNGLIEQCIFPYQNGAISIGRSQDCYVRDNTLFNGTGYLIWLSYSENITIDSNTIYDCDDDVFSLSDLENCTFVNNRVYNIDEPVFWLRDSIDCQIISNTLSDIMGFGVMLTSSHDCIISDNILTSTSGFSFYRSDNNTLANNTIHDTFGEGVTFMEVENCVLENNTITDAVRVWLVDISWSIVKSNLLAGTKSTSGALMLENADRCNVTLNEIHSSLGLGVRVDQNSEQNYFVSNIFYLNAGGNALDDGVSNQWDDGVSIGNTWDDYSGTGVYQIPGAAESIDHYPKAINISPPTSSSTPTTPTGFQLPEDMTLLLTIVLIGVCSLVVIVVLLRKR